MSEPPKECPTYAIGPRESIFALGVASGKFAELESIAHAMFGTIFNFDTDITTMIASKIGLEATIDLCQRQLPKAEYPEAINDLVTYFFAGFGICFDNRNHLHAFELRLDERSRSLQDDEEGHRAHGNAVAR